jgi:hypothetical protein
VSSGSTSVGNSSGIGSSNTVSSGSSNTSSGGNTSSSGALTSATVTNSSSAVSVSSNTGSSTDTNTSVPLDPDEQELRELLKNDNCFQYSKDCSSCIARPGCVYCSKTVVPSCQTGDISGAKNVSLCGINWYFALCSISGDSAGVNWSYILYVVCIIVLVIIFAVLIYIVISTCSFKNKAEDLIKRNKSMVKLNEIQTEPKSKSKSDEKDSKSRGDKDETTSYSSLQ